ncbi:hypothetical protein [Streptomyces sp. B6B3]|uniref:hypothetical protein n=1 Tax=Streptomyces sp. B6B3 TaxID=3153570 RepID=UPI00325EA58E
MDQSAVQTRAPTGVVTLKPLGCQGDPIDWDPIASSGAMSAFCGIVAGFVFAGIVTVIGVRNPPGGDGHGARGLRLLLPCFTGLATASYLYAVIAGERVCSRANTEAVLAGAILGADTVVVIAALAWLLRAYERDTHGEVRFFRGLVHFTAQFAAFILTGSSMIFVHAILGSRVSPWADATMSASGAALMAVLLRCWWRAPPTPPPPWASDHWLHEVFYARRVTTCTWTSLSMTGLLALGAGVASSVPHGTWGSPAPWLVYACGQIALMAAGAILITAVRAVPTEVPDPTARPVW